MELTSLSATNAVKAWQRDIGVENVIAESETLAFYTSSTCGSVRAVTAVLRPGSPEEVRAVVLTANSHGIPLYPVSCGKQWGMGSRLPVKDGAAIVDLGRMNRILEVNAQYQYAVVEPGVTQRQLLDYIQEHELPLMLNVTGSTSDTSLIGNAMDRGVGYFDSRAHGISNMQVVLGSGERINTGFGHYAHALTENLYKYGVGPSLDGLFPQGNFGIVTSACIDLMPMPEARMAAIIKIDSEDKLPRVIDELVRLRTRDVIRTVAHVGNRERSYITLAPLLFEQLVAAGSPSNAETRARAVRMLEESGFGPWSAAIGLPGTKGQLNLAKRELRRAMKGLAKVVFLNDRLVAGAKAAASALAFIPAVHKQLMVLKAVEPVYGFTRGEATDESLKAVYWAAEDFENLQAPDPDHSNSGMLYCLPVIPACGEDVLKVIQETRRIFKRFGFEAAITVNLLDARAMEGVISLAFNRRDKDQTAKAHACIQEMEARYMELGCPPYRVGINSMHHVVREEDPFWQTVRDLKSVFDPNGIIAPGRYNLI